MKEKSAEWRKRRKERYDVGRGRGEEKRLLSVPDSSSEVEREEDKARAAEEEAEEEAAPAEAFAFGESGGEATGEGVRRPGVETGEYGGDLRGDVEGETTTSEKRRSETRKHVDSVSFAISPLFFSSFSSALFSSLLFLPPLAYVSSTDSV